MSRVTALMAAGYEETELISVVDILKRGNIEVRMVSVTGERAVTGNHGISVLTDRLLGEEDLSESDILFLPGGVPGVPNLAAHEGVIAALKAHHAAGKRIAAICAAPSIPGKLGMFAGRKFTCHAGWEKEIDGVDGACFVPDEIVTDELFSTSRGVGTAVDFGLELVRLLRDRETADRIRTEIHHPATI